MQFELRKASDRKFRDKVEITSLEDLMEKIESFWGDNVIIGNVGQDGGPTILIYDYYVE